MSATPPSTTLAGTQSPAPVELLWDRYRSLFYVVVTAVLVALGANYAWNYFAQQKVDAQWSALASGTGLHKLYDSKELRLSGLPDVLEDLTSENLQSALATATEPQRPFVMLALARRAMIAKDWDKAEATLKDLESKYPTHSLVAVSEHPVQAQEPIVNLDETPKPNERKKPEFQPARKGSAVSLMREQIQAGRSYQAPSQFAPVELPKDGPKYKFDLGEGNGTFVVQLLPTFAPLTAKAFQELADGEYWKGFAVDEIRRPTKFSHQARELHIGFASTKDQDDRTKWNTTDAAKSPIEFEANALSHFPFAVSARAEADGKSAADRFWINVDDACQNDGQRVIFGVIVEGQETLQRVCEATMSAQEEEQGRGKPATTIRVVAVTKL
jgi:cyclophilin family peptidyl-prolyl cis-trans isomerase